MIRKALWAACTVGLLYAAASCQTRKKGTFTVSGTFRNADKLAAVEGPISKVYLLEVSYSKSQPPVILDSAKLPVSNGSFTVSAIAHDQEIFELAFGNNAIAVPLINDVPEVRVNVDLGKKDDFYTVNGSDASNQLKDLITVFGKKNYEVEKSMAQIDSCRQANAPDSIVAIAAAQRNSAIQDLNTYLKQVLNTTTNPTLCSLALGFSSQTFTRAEFEASLSDLVRKYPSNPALMSLKQSYDQQLAQMAAQDKQEQSNSWVGKQAPDLALPDVSGRRISLASFKGKYLLVDFWASWCGPCRAENPNVVKAYNEFKGKNFAILGVSLDKEKDAWQEAIRSDRLEWNHVSDLKFWESEAVKTFKFNGIPYNVLIDPQGKIIAESLRGEELGKQIEISAQLSRSFN